MTGVSLIFNPLLAISLLASLLDDEILFFDKKSKRFIPLSKSFNLILNSGRLDPSPLFTKVSLAVFSALIEALLPWRIFVASFAKIIFNEFHKDGATEGLFDSGRWVYDYISVFKKLSPEAEVTMQKTAFSGGGWDDYGKLITVSLSRWYFCQKLIRY